MHLDMESQTSSLYSNERQLVVHLSPSPVNSPRRRIPSLSTPRVDRLDEFETLSWSNSRPRRKQQFGCDSLSFDGYRAAPAKSGMGHPQRLQPFQIVVRQCCSRAEHKGQMRKNAKAIRVPVTRSGQVLPHAFTNSSDIRHLQVEAGIHTIGEAAWQHCTGFYA